MLAERSGQPVLFDAMSADQFDLPERVGPYHVLRVIGEGGMGVVYEAEQREPVRRRVAIKMMKLGMDTKEVVGRFEAERQSLAVMDHPSIARVLDAGVSADGRPFFAMELVAGIAIDAYCRMQRLTTDQRVELMISVCEAVQHAHQKGIIHRDLKPSNILVKEEEGRAIPKVIDFGIAKAIGQRLSQQTVVTSFGQAIGTLSYMSPEQAEQSGLDVDTRTDVYSLGVILHELLIDRVPLDPAEFGAQGFVVRLMQRDTPLPTLTEHISRLEQTRLAAAAANRRTDTTRFRRELSGDLQWVVSRALDKDRNRRYATSNALALDLRRFLASEPVSAHAPSAAYRLRKFTRRNRTSVVAAVLVLLALITGTIGTTLGLLRAREAERIAAQEAEASAHVAAFLAGLFELSDPRQARGRVMSARELLDSGSARVRSELKEQPAIQARLQQTIGEVYTGLGEYGEAGALLEHALAIQRRVLGPDDPQTLLTAYALGDVYFYRSDFARAETTFADVAARRRRVLGPGDTLAIEADGALGTVYVRQERWKEAEAALQRSQQASARVLGADAPKTLTLLNNLQGLYYQQGRYADAESMALQVRAGRKRQLGTDHPAYHTALHNLATIYYRMERFPAAEEVFREALAGRRRVLGEDHPSTLGTKLRMGEMYGAWKRYDEAEPLLLGAIAGWERTTGLSEPAARNAVEALMTMYDASGASEKARGLARRLP